ncbi:MAG: phosphonate C-P lyase system protein PhnH [Eubacteriaceae bacterium]|nr:phosphonate C-P lyase system protein PhnH [Eubacteriaceae bacterium]
MTLQLTKKHSFDMVFDSQKVFRLILEVMSNPTRIANIMEYADRLSGSNPLFLAIAMTLLDNEASVDTCGDHVLSGEIVSLALARIETVDTADFIFISDESGIKDVIENAKCGTLADPQKSATVVMQYQNDNRPGSAITLAGPGIDGQAVLLAPQVAIDAIKLRDAQNYEYPQGIDLLFISGNGDLFAIPRMVKVVE